MAPEAIGGADWDAAAVWVGSAWMLPRAAMIQDIDCRGSLVLPRVLRVRRCLRSCGDESMYSVLLTE